MRFEWDKLRGFFNRKSSPIIVEQEANILSAELHFSSEVDAPSILDFYRGNRHQHVHIRDEDLLSDLVRTGQFLILKDKDTGEILASSGAYPYRVAGDKDRPSFKEIGSTRFSEKLAGFGLYPLFISSQVVHGMLTAPCQHMFIANVYDDSPVGRELLTKKAGWKVIEATRDILDVFADTKDDTAKVNKGKESAPEKTMTWYGSPPSCMPHQARVVLDFIQNKTRIAHKKNGTVLEVDYSGFDLARSYIPHLEVLAQMPEHGNLKDGIESRRLLDVPHLQNFLKRRVLHQQKLNHKPNV